MKVGGYRPANSWLRRQLDRRWQRWLVFCFAGAVVVSVLMTAFIAPRQSTLRMRYEIAQLSHVADQLEREQRHLLLERESLASPNAFSRVIDGLAFLISQPIKKGDESQSGVSPRPDVS